MDSRMRMALVLISFDLDIVSPFVVLQISFGGSSNEKRSGTSSVYSGYCKVSSIAPS